MPDSERPVAVHDSACVMPSAIVGAPFRKLQSGRHRGSGNPTLVGPGCWIGNYAVVGRGVVLGRDTIVDDYVRIEDDATVGERVLFVHRATLGLGVRVGDDCIIGGHVCDRTVVGRSCRIFGDLVHRQSNPLLPWDRPGSREVSPVLHDGVFVGWGATVIGDVVIGEHAYLAAGAIVTRSVPPRHVAFGVNRTVPFEQWGGSLSGSPFFEDENGA